MAETDVSCGGTCELVQFVVTDARFLHIQPRPRGDAPPDLEQRLLVLVKKALESEIHDCASGCECVIEPVQVASRQQIKQVSDGTYTAWYRVTVTKYRTPGECMPASDRLPEGVKE